MTKTENLHDLVTYWAERFPDRPSIHAGGRTITWAELEGRSNEIAGGLQATGIRHGDAVGILMRNRVEFVEALFGVFKCGAAAVLLNIRATTHELTHQIVDSGLRVILSDEDFLPRLDQQVLSDRSVSVFATDPVPGVSTLADVCARATAAPDVQVERDDVALICYTSGTTGLPKGALITHGNIYAGAVAKCLAVGQSFRDRLLIPMPLAYTGGCVALLRDGITPGATTYLEPDSDAERFLDLIEHERITSVVSVATLFEMMMQHPRFESADLSSLTHAVTGGTTVTPHLLQSWMDRGVEITQGYGLTEAGGAFVTLLFPSDAIRKWGFTGKKLMHLDVIIVDDKGNELPPGESGEVLVRGPVVMKGYLGQPEATAKALEGGWLHTGDIGFLDEEGFLKIVDRVKDMLISGGLNVYPAEIERAIGGVPGLDEFCVIGVPDDRWGEVPMIVASSLDRVDIDALWERCCETLADYKRPQYIVEYGPLPRTLSAKITKKPLRDHYPKAPVEAIALKRVSRLPEAGAQSTAPSRNSFSISSSE